MEATGDWANQSAQNQHNGHHIDQRIQIRGVKAGSVPQRANRVVDFGPYQLSDPYVDLIHPICQYERFGNRALFGLSEGPDCLIVYLSELRFINPRSDTSEF
jgi:hypothetical protein